MRTFLFRLLVVAVLLCRQEISEVTPSVRQFAPTAILLNDGTSRSCAGSNSGKFTLSVRVLSRTPPVYLQAVLYQDSDRGVSAENLLDESNPRAFNWIAGEHAAGRHPWIQGTFCVSSDSAVGVGIVVRLAEYGPHACEIIRVAGEHSSSYANPLVEIRVRDDFGRERELEPTNGASMACPGDDFVILKPLLRIGGTPFCPIYTHRVGRDCVPDAPCENRPPLCVPARVLQ